MGWHSGEGDRDQADAREAADASSEALAADARKPDDRPARRKRPEATPAQRALGLLVRREHSRRELTRKLTARGVEPDAAVAAVDKMQAAGWQDDGRFAEQLIRSRAATGYGPVRIRAELAMHGLPRDAVTNAMESAEADWPALARDLVQRRFGPAVADDRDLRHKAADWLLRRGFSNDHVRAATRFDPDD